MCGITGFIEKNTSGVNRSQIIHEMTDAITHRGPDEEAFYEGKHGSLGMRRLSIIDLTKGLYPFSNPAKNIFLIFNGEIYNFPELKTELELQGSKFKSTCDGEVILAGYEKWGVSIFSRLRGMFAIAIMDERTDSLILARDRFGIKPLYYTDTENFFAFASEAKALYTLKKSANLSLNLDNEALLHLLGFMYLPESAKTIVTQVKKLEPASYAVYKDGKLSTYKYWNLKDISRLNNINYEEAVDLVDEKLSQAVEMHLLADVPLGLMLSGGVDSALLAAIMSKKLDVNLNTFTAKFDHKFNESNLAAQTAKYLGTSHTEINIDVSDINKNISNYVGIFDDLSTFDGGTLTTSLICEQIRTKGIKVLLLGEGADEVFGGYSWYGLSKLPFSLIPRKLRDHIYYYAISRNISFKNNFYSKYWSSKSLPTDSTFNDIAFREMFVQLPNHLLMKVDKGSMHNSIECRVPYLDHELVQLVYSLPDQYKLAGTFADLKRSNEKRILRDVAKRYLPEETAYRKKRGFLLPMNDVIVSDLENVKKYVLSDSAVSQSVLPKDFREALFVKTSKSWLDMQNEYFIWRLFILEAWADFYGISN